MKLAAVKMAATVANGRLAMHDTKPFQGETQKATTSVELSLREVWHNNLHRLAQGDIGPLPVIIALAFIAIIFQVANHHFLTPINLANLMVQISATGTLAVGVTLVLLIGEIDLSVGAVSGLTAGIMAVLSVKAGWPGIAAVMAGITVGVLIGLLQGFWFAKLHVPSFVVTLAGYLAWQGALLWVLGSTGTVNLNDSLIVGLANTRLPVLLGWALGFVFVAVYSLSLLRKHQRRHRAQMETRPLAVVLSQVVVVAAAILLAIYVLNINRNPVASGTVIRGVPSAVLFLLGFVIIFDWITRRTRFGRYVFAVGGNVEATRRAGINVDRIRIAIFGLCSALAACGGILAGSRLLAVNQSSGSGDVLLNAIAAAVIGGTSLFGGRGSTWSALLGALVIGSVANGMDLLAFPSSIKFMVTGAVLLLAVTLDAYARSRRQLTGRS
jgi:D-xylose transport system permease protein